jgi:hypothetical protein
VNAPAGSQSLAAADRVELGDTSTTLLAALIRLTILTPATSGDSSQESVDDLAELAEQSISLMQRTWEQMLDGLFSMGDWMHQMTVSSVDTASAVEDRESRIEEGESSIEDRESRVEDSEDTEASHLPAQSSILDLQSSILDEAWVIALAASAWLAGASCRAKAEDGEERPDWTDGLARPGKVA